MISTRVAKTAPKHARFVRRTDGVRIYPLEPEKELQSQDTDSDAAWFRSWLERCNEDPDLGRDARMMVPVFHDLGREKTKVWAKRCCTIHSLGEPQSDKARKVRNQ